ncbi:Com family DNA-binding transcriptional regulator [Roseinatronobacter sp. NSM]|uniref:Com family DNA-binding transcriptional regulator n=1 Tax=Roseinatronobacter sp. NSM TaxID=3457785 RepID=UPI00403632A3
MAAPSLIRGGEGEVIRLARSRANPWARACARLLFCAEPDALSGVVSIKCPRCRAMNILRPRALSPERPQRPIVKGQGQ